MRCRGRDTRTPRIIGALSRLNTFIRLPGLHGDDKEGNLNGQR